MADEDKDIDQRGHCIVIIYGSDAGLHKQNQGPFEEFSNLAYSNREVLVIESLLSKTKH